MRETEWHDLCRREQEQGREVTGITLAPPSAQQLANDILSAPGTVIRLFGDGGKADKGEPGRVITAGGRVGKLVNWAADTVIKVDVDPDAETDTVTVRDADGQVRTVVLAETCR